METCKQIRYSAKGIKRNGNMQAAKSSTQLKGQKGTEICDQQSEAQRINGWPNRHASEIELKDMQAANGLFPSGECEEDGDYMQAAKEGNGDMQADSLLS